MRPRLPHTHNAENTNLSDVHYNNVDDLEEWLIGTTGDDRVVACDGNDKIDGGEGNDRVGGDGGNDTVIGGKGNDTFYGGPDEDTFLINKDDGHDIIGDATTEDVLKFGKGITTGNLSAKLDGDNLVLGIGKDQSVTLQGWKTQTGRLPHATLNDGTKVNLQDPA